MVGAPIGVKHQGAKHHAVALRLHYALTLQAPRAAWLSQGLARQAPLGHLSGTNAAAEAQ